MKLKPLNDYCVLLRISDAETTKSGIVIPDVAKDRGYVCRAEVICVPATGIVEAGDIVLLEADRAISHKIEGTEYMFIETDKLISVIKEK